MVKVGYGDGRSVEFAYNELNQLNEINDWLGKTTLENDILGRLTEKLLPNGVKQAYSYLPGGNLLSMESFDATNMLAKSN